MELKTGKGILTVVKDKEITDFNYKDTLYRVMCMNLRKLCYIFSLGQTLYTPLCAGLRLSSVLRIVNETST
jgi:hypothetical protein